MSNGEAFFFAYLSPLMPILNGFDISFFSIQKKNWSELVNSEFCNIILIFKVFFIWLWYYLQTYFHANKTYVCRVAIKSEFCQIYVWDFMNQNHSPGLSYYYSNKYKFSLKCELATVFNY